MSGSFDYCFPEGSIIAGYALYFRIITFQYMFIECCPVKSRSFSYPAKVLIMTGDNSGNIDQKMRISYLESMFEKMELLLNSTDVLIAFLDSEGHIIFANKSMAESLGADIHNCEDTVIWDFMDAETGNRRKKYFRECLEKNKLVNFEDERNGRYFINSFAPVSNNNAIVMVRNITPRRRAEIALRESEEKYRSLVENANDGICIFTEEAVLYANRRFSDLVGFQADGIIGTSLSLYIAPSERDCFIRNIASLAHGEKTQFVFDSMINHRDGIRINIEFNISVITYNGHRAYLAFMRDITNRVNSAAELRRHRDHLGELVYERTLELTLTNKELRHEIAERKLAQESLQSAKSEAEFYIDLMSHDLTNFNHALLGNIDLLDHAINGDDKVRRLLNSCRRQIARSKLLIHKVRTFSKIKDIAAADLMEIDLNVCITDSINLMKKMYPGNDVQFVFEPEGKKNILGADILSAAVNIVLENAVAHAGAQIVNVEISVMENNVDGLDVWTLCVADNGPGFSDEQKKNAFTTDGNTLRGLGLPLANEIMKTLGGRIKIEDRTPGVPQHGALVTLSIPKAR